MKNISEVDKNFSIKTNIEKDDICFYDVKEKPFEIYGVFYENGKFRRLPEEVAKTVNDGVYWLTQTQQEAESVSELTVPMLQYMQKCLSWGKCLIFL